MTCRNLRRAPGAMAYKLIQDSENMKSLRELLLLIMFYSVV